MGRRKKAEVTEMIETVDIIPQEDVATEPNYKGDYEVVTVSKPNLNIRSGAGTDNDIIGMLPNHSRISCRGKFAVDDNGKVWLDIDIGYVMLDFLKKV